MVVRVSVVMTVLNEAGAIQRLLASLARQSRRPDEVVIVDGGSRDDTVMRIERFAQSDALPIRVIQAPGRNISQGRNLAIQAAGGDSRASSRIITDPTTAVSGRPVRAASPAPRTPPRMRASPQRSSTSRRPSVAATDWSASGKTTTASTAR